MKARYIRISSLSQNEARQLARAHNDELLYIDKISGAIPFAKRPQALNLLDDIENKNINYLSVSSIDRLGRSTIDILQTIKVLTELNVNLKVEDLGLESLINNKPNPTFSLISAVMANLSELERTTLRSRQEEGIAEAKKRGGVYNGRIKGTVETKEQVLGKYKEVVRYIKMNKSLRDIASRCDVSLGTVQKVKKLVASE
jgi:DNA invertase Pin-like site-specific DNA recombinase